MLNYNYLFSYPNWYIIAEKVIKNNAKLKLNSIVDTYLTFLTIIIPQAQAKVRIIKPIVTNNLI